MTKHQELLNELESYSRAIAGVKDLMAHISIRLHAEMARYNWVGFYVADPSVPRTLFLGPYEGSFLPLETITFDQGLCGAAAASRRTVVVNKVAADMRYLSAAEMVKSEMVVPVVVSNKLVAEIDVESYFPDTFTQKDQEFVQSCAALVGRFMEQRGVMEASAAVKKRSVEA